MEQYFLTQEYFGIEADSKIEWTANMGSEWTMLKMQYCRLCDCRSEMEKEAKDTPYYYERKRLWILIDELSVEIKHWQDFWISY